MENVDEYSWMDEQGNFHVRAIEDDLCEVVLSQNCLHVKVNFMYLLPNKKAKWISGHQNEPEDMYDNRS